MSADNDMLKVDKDKWVSDHDSRFCQECGDAFTFINRRHHCRFCGRLLDKKGLEAHEPRSTTLLELYQRSVHTNVFVRKYEQRRHRRKQKRQTIILCLLSSYTMLPQWNIAPLEVRFLSHRRQAVRGIVVRCWLPVIGIMLASLLCECRYAKCACEMKREIG